MSQLHAGMNGVWKWCRQLMCFFQSGCESLEEREVYRVIILKHFSFHVG